MRIVAVLAVVGCGADGVAGGDGADGKSGQAGQNGVNGAAGATGPAGPVGPPGGVYRWHDADGEQVTEGSDLSVFDDNGNLWTINIETARLGANIYVQRYYADPDCNGDSYVSSVAPRFVISGEQWGEPNRFYVRRDDARLIDECAAGWLYQGSCLPYDTCVPMVQFSDLESVDSPPGQGWAAPLHPEPL